VTLLVWFLTLQIHFDEELQAVARPTLPEYACA
jgi:hypothetical protein